MIREKYDSMPGLRRSLLWEMNKSPMHFKYASEHPEEDSDALRFGIAAHMAILEPERFAEVYQVAPNVDRRTKAGKALYEDFRSRLEDWQEVITWEEADRIVAMKEAFLADPLVHEAICGCIPIEKVLDGDTPVGWPGMYDILSEKTTEQIYTWTDPETGEAMKMKADIVLRHYNGTNKTFIFDYKTAASCADGAFERSAKSYGYKFQAGFYTEGYFQNTFKEAGFVFIAQEKTAPYACRVYICEPGYIEQGRKIYRQLLDQYHYCKEHNTWPGYGMTRLLEENYDQ